MRVVKANDVQSRHTDRGDFLETGAELQEGRGARSFRHYIAANVKGRYELLTYIAVNPTLYQRYWPAVQPLVSTWSFANLNPSAEPGVSSEPAPRRIQGRKGWKAFTSVTSTLLQRLSAPVGRHDPTVRYGAAGSVQDLR